MPEPSCVAKAKLTTFCSSPESTVCASAGRSGVITSKATNGHGRKGPVRQERRLTAGNHTLPPQLSLAIGRPESAVAFVAPSGTQPYRFVLVDPFAQVLVVACAARLAGLRFLDRRSRIVVGRTCIGPRLFVVFHCHPLLASGRGRAAGRQ